MSTSPRIAAVAAALLLLLAACATDDDAAVDLADTADEAEDQEADDDVEEAAEPEAAEETADDEAGDPGAVTLAVSTTDLGDILVDGDDMTLYMFEPDEAGESTCYDDCAENWPPLLVDGDAEAGDGVDAELLDTTERTDGTMQVTYDGWPLYHWAGDAEPGETNGQGVGDVWWVLAPDGTPQTDEDEEEAGPGGGYDY